MRAPATTITIRGKQIKVAGPHSKANLARRLLAEGYTVSEISKAVPMAYSQVHKINKIQAGYEIVRPDAPSKAWGNLPPKGRPATKPTKAKVRPLNPRIGKLRTPGYPSDVAVGECLNCEHDLVIRGGPTGYMLTHINISTEEYLAVVQFCNAVPRALMQ
jgi:hypothetical protein